MSLYDDKYLSIANDILENGYFDKIELEFQLINYLIKLCNLI